ncbi:hypothetical protein Tco_1522612 [Tanacetum coccineum]
MAQVQEAAQFYTEEDWDTIRAKLEANADLVKEIAGEDVSEADYAQRMVGLISQRRKLIAEQKAKAQRDKPMTQAQQRQYMATYLKNQGGWKLAQIKKLTDEELKEKFEYLMRSMERFVPMDTEKESRKRTGVELQTESSKKLKSDTREDVSVPKEKDKESVKREEEFEIKKPVLRYTKRKSLARKGLQKKPESAKSGTEEDVEAYMEERVDEPSSEEFPMSSIPQGPAPAKIVKWQIIKTGKRGAYQIIREDNTDVVYVNFQGLLNDLTRDDLKELYRLMMLKYGDNRPEEEFERVLWGDLKTMFDPPSEEDAIWKLPHQQQILNWRYFHSCSVHCLTVEAAHIYMLTEVKYPLPPRVCKAMLEKKLLGDRKDESTMSNRHKDWLVQEQTALGKDFSNPFMADNLPKIEAHNEDTQRNLKFTSEDQVRGGLLGIIVNRLKSGSYRVKSGGHIDLDLFKLAIVLQKAKHIQDFGPTAALFDIEDNKAPRPDGFTSKLFKASWGVVGGDVSMAMKEFFASGKMLGELNTTIIFIVPKSKNPRKASDYRHIACCGAVYKCISKVITNRIKTILYGLIYLNQGAFIGGRQISDNILLIQELMCGYSWKGKSRRDNRFMFHWGCKDMGITHMCFVDDLMLLCHADMILASIPIRALDELSLSSGLYPSIAKSIVYFANVPNNVRCNILMMMPFEEGELPARSCNIWFDYWQDRGPLSRFIDQRTIVLVGLILNTKISDLICNSSWTWPNEWFNDFVEVLNIPVPILNNEIDDRTV